MSSDLSPFLIGVRGIRLGLATDRFGIGVENDWRTLLFEGRRRGNDLLGTSGVNLFFTHSRGGNHRGPCPCCGTAELCPRQHTSDCDASRWPLAGLVVARG
jgi:hypothetical protein